MLTLDTLARMAKRMPSESFGDSGQPPFRRPDSGLRVRRVTLPPVSEETRRAVGLFAFVVGVSVLTITAVGLVLTFGGQVAAGQTPSVEALAASALWYGGWTAAFIVPFAGIGLVREIARYRRVRRAIGESAWIGARGVLHSEDGARRVALG